MTAIRYSLFIIFALFLAGCESGHVVEVRIAATRAEVSDPLLVQLFYEISKRIGRSVEGPIVGPDTDARYVARPEAKNAERHFDLFLLFARHRSFFIRTFATQSQDKWADSALSEIEQALKAANITYSIRKN
jgi:hypothetical protein